MKTFNITTLEKFRNASNYQLIEDGIYNDLTDVDGFSTYRIAVVITSATEQLSVDEMDKQLESYFVYIDETIHFDKNKMHSYIIIGGELEDLQNFKANIEK